MSKDKQENADASTKEVAPITTKPETKADPTRPFETEGQVKRLEEIAQLWFGTPFLTNTQIVGKGVDCVRLPVCILVSCGALPQDFTWPAYGSLAPKEVNWKAIKAGIDEHGFEEVKDLDKLQPGDLLVFSIGKEETVHLGLHLSDGFAHVMPSHTARRDALTATWKKRLKSAWRPTKTK